MRPSDLASLLLFPLLVLPFTVAANENDPHAHHKAMMQEQPTSPDRVEVDLRDRMLVNQHGEEVRFVSDVIGDRIVVMDFVYTTCTTVCPVLSALFSKVQQQLGDRIGRDVVLVSVTVDPARDTPQRLASYSKMHRAGEGWSWLTGPKPVVEDVLIGVGAYSASFEDHASMVLIGDGKTGEWRRLFGFPKPERMVALVNELASRRGTGD